MALKAAGFRQRQVTREGMKNQAPLKKGDLGDFRRLF
jgi:hypothetical protein